MGETKHTPGPWWAAEPEPRTGRRMIISRPRACGVAIAFTEGDANLIRAAPALLAELRKAADELEAAMLVAAALGKTRARDAFKRCAERALAVVALAEGRSDG